MSPDPVSSPPPAMRLCFSGDPTCAGLSPCEVCRRALASEIINHALKAAQCDSVEQAEAFFTAYNAAKTTLLDAIAKQIAEVVRQNEASARSPAPPPATVAATPAAVNKPKTTPKITGKRAPTPSPTVSEAAKPRHDTTQKAGTST